MAATLAIHPGEDIGWMVTSNAVDDALCNVVQHHHPCFLVLRHPFRQHEHRSFDLGYPVIGSGESIVIQLWAGGCEHDRVQPALTTSSAGTGRRVHVGRRTLLAKRCRRKESARTPCVSGSQRSLPSVGVEGPAIPVVRRPKTSRSPDFPKIRPGKCESPRWPASSWHS